LVVCVTATGNLEPINQVDVGSELSGIIRTVEVDYNDSVRVGQTLAKLDTDRLDAQLLESEAVLESAQAKVREAEATSAEKGLFLDRVATLVAKDLSAQSELDAAKASFQRAQANLASAKAQVSQAEATLNARRRSPSSDTGRRPWRVW
jgi:HlyD family secretion protein